jgi:NADP-dependent 3-hydroxy acid dehydrogenase YdfG
VAVITGPASGIGKGLAGYCAQQEMKIVLADVEVKALFQAESEIMSKGADLLAVVTDVSKIDDVKSLANKTIESFGQVDFFK